MKEALVRPALISLVGVALVVWTHVSEDRYTWNGIDVDVLGWIFTVGGALGMGGVVWWHKNA